MNVTLLFPFTRPILKKGLWFVIVASGHNCKNMNTQECQVMLHFKVIKNSVCVILDIFAGMLLAHTCDDEAGSICKKNEPVLSYLFENAFWLLVVEINLSIQEPESWWWNWKCSLASCSLQACDQWFKVSDVVLIYFIYKRFY